MEVRPIRGPAHRSIIFRGAEAQLRAALAAAALLAAAVGAAGSSKAGNGGAHEKTIPVPRSREARLDWSDRGCAVESVRIRNYPNREDVEKARREDPDDHSWLWWEFEVSNRGRDDCRIRLQVEVLDARGRVVREEDKSDTVDAEKSDDQIRLSMRMKTLEIADAPRVRIRADIGPK